MNLPIFYTPRSKQTLSSVYSFIESKFGRRSADKFLTKVENTIRLMSTQPYMFKASSIDEHVRIAFITKQTSQFYMITDESIHLLFFWDNRQEPILPRY